MFKIVKFATTDFSTVQLPSNRREAFFDIIKQRWRLLLGLGLIFCISCLPMIILSYTNIAGTQIIYDQIADGELSKKTGLMQIFSFHVSSALMKIPCFSLAVAICAPLTLITIKLSWQRGILFKADFKKSLACDSAGAGMIGLATGILSFCCTYLNALLSVNATGFLSVFVLIPQFLFYFVLIPVVSLFIPLHNIYSDTVWRKIKNAFFLYCRNFPKILLFCLISYTLLFPMLLCNAFFSATLLLVYCAIVFPFLHLAWILFCNKIFDMHINQFSFPHLVNRGLWHVPK